MVIAKSARNLATRQAVAIALAQSSAAEHAASALKAALAAAGQVALRVACDQDRPRDVEIIYCLTELVETLIEFQAEAEDR